MGITIRRMTTDDAEGVRRVTRLALEWLGACEGWSPEQTGHMVADQASPGAMELVLTRQQAWVALLDGVVVGAASAVRCELARLFVDPARHRRGVGTALLRAVEQQMSATGCEGLRAKAPPPSLPFYLAMGMVEEGREPCRAEEMRGHEVVLLSKRFTRRE